ncbi:hypothetical protein V3C99_018268, partial [Haemonchus contortus]
IDAATGETAPPQNPPRGLPEVPKQPISGALGVRSVKNGSGQPGATPNGQPGGPSSEGQERNPFGVGGNALVEDPSLENEEESRSKDLKDRSPAAEDGIRSEDLIDFAPEDKEDIRPKDPEDHLPEDEEDIRLHKQGIHSKDVEDLPPKNKEDIHSKDLKDHSLEDRRIFVRRTRKIPHVGSGRSPFAGPGGWF